MAIYVAIDYFEDTKDDMTAYMPGTIYPRSGARVSKARLKELASKNNAKGVPVIQLLNELPAKGVV